jgi:hypothetical protein
MPPSPSVEVSDLVVDETSVRGKAAPKKTGKRVRGRTIYLHDDLFERILVASHRRGRTISEFVSSILDRHVPNHLSGRPDAAGPAVDPDLAIAKVLDGSA